MRFRAGSCEVFMFRTSDNKGLDRFDIAKLTEKCDVAMFNLNNSKFLHELHRLKDLRSYTILSEVGRPDLLSEALYGQGNYQYWWIIMSLNGLCFPDDLKNGLIIKYPSLDQIENVYFELSTNSSTKTNSSEISTLEIL